MYIPAIHTYNGDENQFSVVKFRNLLQITPSVLMDQNFLKCFPLVNSQFKAFLLGVVLASLLSVQDSHLYFLTLNKSIATQCSI